jgi:hypothetical protein
MTEFGTIGKAICDFPIVVNSIRGSISHGLRSNFTSKNFLHFREEWSLFKTLQNLSGVEFSSPVFTTSAQYVAPFKRFKPHCSMLRGS